MVYYDCHGIATFEIRSLEPIIFTTVLMKCRVLTSFIRFRIDCLMTLSSHEINHLFFCQIFQISFLVCFVYFFFVKVCGKSREIAVRIKYHATFYRKVQNESNHCVYNYNQPSLKCTKNIQNQIWVLPDWKRIIIKTVITLIKRTTWLCILVSSDPNKGRAQVTPSLAGHANYTIKYKCFSTVQYSNFIVKLACPARDGATCALSLYIQQHSYYLFTNSLH